MVRSLMDLGAIGLVTTHDLASPPSWTDCDQQAINAHFADEFVDGQLVFDYTLKPGVVNTRNALALMRSVGLRCVSGPAVRPLRNPED